MASIHASACADKAVTKSCTETIVPATTCAALIAKHGVPLVLKVDVEGADLMCLSSLRGLPQLPPYIAVEDHTALDLLVSLGYSQFKLVYGRAISSCDRVDRWAEKTVSKAGRQVDALSRHPRLEGTRNGPPEAPGGGGGGKHDVSLSVRSVPVGNSIGGMPWECANTVPSMATSAPGTAQLRPTSSWSTADDTRRAPHFNQKGGGHDLYAWRPSSQGGALIDRALTSL